MTQHQECHHHDNGPGHHHQQQLLHTRHSLPASLPPPRMSAQQSHVRFGVLALVLLIVVHALLYWPPWLSGESEQDRHPHVEASSFATRLPAIPRHRPDAFEGCGIWQEHYQAYHRRVLAGQLPPRYLVAVRVQAGLADNLLGIVTAFYLALLTGRAFQITSGYQELAPLEAAFDAPFVNWTRPLDPRHLTQHLYYTMGGSRQYDPADPSVNTSHYASMYLVNDDGANEIFAVADLHTATPATPVLFTASNRGRTYRLFDNPHHKQALFNMGLRPETAFACAFRFLFSPNEATENKMAELRPSLQLDEGASKQTNIGAITKVLRIGIQIRVGDGVLDSSGAAAAGVRLEDYMPFFDCAKQIEGHGKPSADAKVIWYLVSDSQSLRQQALDHFGSDLLVTSPEAHGHVNCHMMGTCDNSTDLGAFIQSAATDVLLLAETDYQVISLLSGFGKVGAWLSRRWHSTYFAFPGQPARCGPAEWAPYADMAASYSGVRT